MNKILSNYMTVLKKISETKKKFSDMSNQPKLVAVSKNFEEDDIKILLNEGHLIFGENRVQEADRKWNNLKNIFPNTELHLIGPLQSNKVKQALNVFDVIQTVDREKIVKKIHETITLNENINLAEKRFMIQVNTGNESQKSGILVKNVFDFNNWCANDIGLNIFGLMCIPPQDEPASVHFNIMNTLAKECNLKNLSMGMSGDYETAIKFGASYVRIGSAIFGQREIKFRQ